MKVYSIYGEYEHAAGTEHTPFKGIVEGYIRKKIRGKMKIIHDKKQKRTQKIEEANEY